MIRTKWLGSRGRAASFAVALWFSFAMSGLAVYAQAAPGNAVLDPTSPPAFLVAPSVSLGYSPTGIAAGALTSSGRTDLVTADYAAGKITVFAGLGDGSFAAGLAYAAGAQPTSLVVADVDGDGRADVILANPSEGVISIFAGNGDGTLGARRTLPIGFAPSFIAVGDFTGNGRPDIAVAGAAAKSLAILQNDGTGHFNRPVNYALGSTPAALIAADFDRDGHLDLAIAATSGTLTVFLGKGNVQFASRPDISALAGALTSVAVADFNRDGNPDLVVTSAALNRAAVLLGQGDGNFAAALSLAVGNAPIAAHVADVDGDGIPDLIVINEGSNTFSVLNGVGDGTFKNAAYFVVGNAPLGAVAADFYGTGRVDLATINQLGQTLSVPAGNGDGTFAAGRAYVAGAQPVAVASGDLTHSGKSDLVVGSYCSTDATCGGSGSAAVLLAGPDGGYQLASTYAMGTGSVAIRLIDVNADGQLDLVALNRADKSISVRLGAGDATFGSLITTSLSAAPVAFASADFNNDGNIDLAVLGDCGSATCSQPGSFELLLGAGDGNFHSVSTHAAGYSPVAIAAGKTSPAGNADVVIANRCGMDAACKSGGGATVLLGNGTGAFTPAKDVALGNSPSSIALADLRGTGILDMVVSRSADNTIAILPGSGNGSFGAAVSYPVGHAPGTLVIADFNGDGQADVAVANTADSSVSVLFGKAGGMLQPAFTVPVAGNASTLAAVGLPTSGHASLATASGSVATPATAASVTVVSNLVVRPMATVTPGAVTLAVTPAGSLSVNQSVTYTVTVTANGANPTPTGLVQFQYSTDGGNTFLNLADCAGATGLALNGSGAASCITQQLPAGAAVILQANYLGDGTIYSGSASNQVTRVVNAAATTISVTSSPAAPTTDQVVTLSAVIQPTTGPAIASDAATIKGTTVFNDTTTATTLCAASSVTFNASTGTASLACQVPVLAVATHSIQAVYVSTDPNYTGSTGALGLPVTAAPTTTSVVPSPASPNVNGSVTFNVTIAPNVTGTQSANANLATIAGTITVFDGATAISSCTAVAVTYSAANGYATASCAFNGLAGRSRSITAQFTSSNSSYLNSTSSPAVSLQVNALTPTVTVTTGAANSTPLNTSITLTATLSGVAFSHNAPAGTVSFSFGTTPIAACATQPLTAQVATCTTSALAAGTHDFTATFNPTDSNFNTATSTGLAHTVTALTPTVTVTTAAGSSTALNASITFTATLTGVAFTPVAPSGAVSFSSNGAAITGCTAQPLNGSQQATCTTSGLVAGSDSITATLAADSNFNTATSPGLPHTVTKLTPTVIVTGSTGTSSAVNAPVTLTATLSGVAFTPVVPGATVNFQVDGTTIANCGAQAVTSQHATCTTSALTASSPTLAITAVYLGDLNFETATSAALTYTVTALTPTLSITAVPGTSAPVGTSVTFTAALGSATFTPTVPNGTLAWKINGVASGDCPATTIAGQKATCTTSALVSPADTITATYSADTNFTVSAPTTITETVTKSGNTTVNLTAAPGSTTVNVPVTFTAVIPGPTTAAPFPTGSVTFTQGASTLCGAPVVLSTPTPPLGGNNEPTAKCTVPFSVANSFPVIANYNSDANFAAGSSNQVSVTIAADPTSTTLTYTGTPSVNQPLVFIPKVTPNDAGAATPQGSITLAVSGTPAPTFSCANGVVAVSNGTAPSCTITFGSSGSYSVKATFTPSDLNFSSSTSSTTALTVSTGSAGVLVTSAGPSTVNATVTFTASFSQAITGTLPTGTVTYTDTFVSNGSTTTTTLCTRTLSGGAMPSCDYAFASAGTHSITAAYSGDGNFKAATSDPFTQPITQTGTTTSVDSSLAAGSAVNQPVTFIATVKPATSGAAVPGGNIIFSFTAPGAGSPTPICGTGVTVTRAAPNATASCTAALPAAYATAYIVTATYSGDSNFLPGTAGTVNQAVSKTATSTTLNAPASAMVNQPVAYTATIQPAYEGATAPTGTVDFTDTSTNPATTLCTARPVIATSNSNGYVGTATCATSFDSARAGDSIVATYKSGDANFTDAPASAPVSQAVTAALSTVALVSSLPGGSVATQAVTFTATLTPAYPVANGPPPTGTVTFTLINDAVDQCPPVTFSSSATPPYAATCTIAVSSSLQTGSIGVIAKYSGDPNFVASSAQIAQPVANFNLAVTAPTTGSLNLSQGQNNSADPLFKQNITVAVIPTANFADKLDLICQVFTGANNTTGAAATDPSCSVAPANPVSATSVSVTLNASATAPVGAYTVLVTAADDSLQGLQQITEFTVYVINVAGTLSLGSTGVGTVPVIFNTSTAGNTGTLGSVGCATVVQAPLAGKVTCSASATAPITSATTSVNVILSLSANTASLSNSTGLYAASLLGVPLLALFGWLGTRRSARRNFFRIVGLLLFGLGLAYMTACGGGFNRPQGNTIGGVTAGSYSVQVTASDGTHTFYAIIPLQVN